MIINEIMKQKKLSVYKLSKMTGIPYMTLNDMCNGKTNFRRCPAENVYKVAKALGTTVEVIMESSDGKRIEFELYKSHICHQLKEKGDLTFLIDLLESDQIRKYADKEWWPECLYLLAMLDYLSRINNFPLVDEFDDLRNCKLKTILYPRSVVALAYTIKNRDIKKEAYDNSIPEFVRFNIVESDIRNVI